jgi:protein tyrosine phosphatase (PTP) superfamily phosphohydrolase (DUF442 family)
MTVRQQTLLALSSTLLIAFIFLPANAAAGQLESFRALDPVADLNLTAVLQNSPSVIPAVPLPSQVFQAGPAAAAAPLPNFSQVSPTLYRSGQPTQAGIATIKNTGIKTILKLNADSPAEAGWIAGAGMNLETMVLTTQHSPTYDEVDAALAILNDPAKQPVLVHCKLGHDRTGAVVGAYRISVQGWSVAQAAAEAKSLGYSDPHFQEITAYLQGYLAHLHPQAAQAN